ADDGGLPLELADGVDIVLRHLLDALVGKDLRVLLGRLNGFRVIWPAGRERGVALLFEERAPVVPTAGEEPEAVDEHDRLLPLRGAHPTSISILGRPGEITVHQLAFHVPSRCIALLGWLVRKGDGS